MPVAATQVNGETVQAIGARARFLCAAESSWDTIPTQATRVLRLLPGETLDQNLAIYRSKQLRPDRMHNAMVRGSMDPGGNLPFELSADGWNWSWYSLLLPSAITTTGPTGTLVDPTTAPTPTPSASGGNIPAGTYYYVYTALNSQGETKVSSPTTGQVLTGNNSSVALSATTVSGATSYNFYRGTNSGGPYYFVATSTSTSATDTASANQTGLPAPDENTSGVTYTHVIKAGTTGNPLPIGHSIEKQFLDLVDGGNNPAIVYETLSGCKVDKCTLNFRVDAIPEGTFDVIARRFQAGSSSQFTSLSNDSSVKLLAPYTSAYVALYEGNSGNQLGLCTDFTLTIDNAYRRRNGFVLGSIYRQNLKPGTRLVDFSMRAMFQDLTYFNKAVNGTNTSIRIVASSPNSVYSHTFYMGTVNFIPNQSAPRVHDDGPLEIQLRGEALPDESTGTDLQLTIVTPESNITT